MTQKLARLSEVNPSKILAWVLTAIVLPGLAFALHNGMNKLDLLTVQVQAQALEQAKISGTVEKLETKLNATASTTQERNDDRREDVAELKGDVRALTDQVQRLAIAVERLNFQAAADRARRSP